MLSNFKRCFLRIIISHLVCAFKHIEHKNYNNYNINFFLLYIEFNYVNSKIER